MTELVINALKHAFPDDKAGAIWIDYRSSGDDWTLSVTDDGVGMAHGGDTPKAGLGSGIVEALARNLQAQIELKDARPGVTVTISHQKGAGLPANLPTAA